MPPTTPELVDDEHVPAATLSFSFSDLHCDHPDFAEQLEAFWLSPAMAAIRPTRGPQESRLERFEVLVLNFLAAKGRAERYVKPLTEREIRRLEKLQREAETAIVY